MKARVSCITCWILVLCACNLDKKITDLSEASRPDKQYAAAIELNDATPNPQILTSLCAALKSPSASVRFAAAAAMEGQIWGLGDSDVELRCNALLALVEMLDDPEVGTIEYSSGLIFPMRIRRTTPSPRSRALLTLSAVMMSDFGLDKSAWESEIRRRFPHRYSVSKESVGRITPAFLDQAVIARVP